jgi:hypothetical protein
MAFYGMGGGFLLVEVTNRHPKQKPIRGALARIEYEVPGGKVVTVDGFWSAKPGDAFVPGGPRRVNIGYGDRRMLALAVFLAKKETWVKFGHGDYPPHYGNPQSGGILSRSGERVDLGAECSLALQITATGAHVQERYRLYGKHVHPAGGENPHWQPEVEHLTL